MLTLNVDWFQLFEGRTHASGALYLSMNNLPREERMKPENIILVGVMPGPKEAKIDQMNNFLESLVDELVELYGGVTVKTASFPNGTIVYATLISIACDIPAARKTTGFTGHASTNACHKCKRHFSVIAGSSKIDYSRFDNESWVTRTKEMNAIYANMWACTELSAERADLEKQNGTWFSELHCLHYFDPIRCTIVDPMHNLFLGTAKHMISSWKDPGYLPAAVLVRMQCLADDALPEKDFKNWTLFVKACQKLTGPSAMYSEIDSAHQLLGDFGKKCEILYGNSSITPNMYLHMNLRELMFDFGPVYEFCLQVTFMRVFLEKAFNSTFLYAYFTNLLPPIIQFLESIAQVMLVSALLPLPCLENGHPPVLAFNLPMFLQVVTNPWYNVTRSEALPPTTLPIKLQPLTMMKDDHYQ
ncbi:hypothetical protein PHYBLDRAFT_62168 [Phycomyces blakesleeanus NRRL 1555(-)]|uniref:Uncharacterized protein n=1 Tax=Phycomyces blakesleeanus (strain ATCC 8743b / DSM 1359 / FGSC 10004 / NBRC 33097 / NRRL 1555) TaxID=763407 RepID=A0A167Q4T4_PHYB8|nr:hypothetical protein PHYBLDRAFT_62168 [Phycomyces blakesleeanus NRRL 1555(-)]OAD79069.1 hypothetical protein PHYBLDRAFT_62168 [Phycomyces blakesleeanus NRRL 1555(-)]|eukprot:XP_018297109.1 hypothetical protein PHYBLDRAFT_62168 [Phycomyces blakesleeanus NRRL 1555(-)]